MIKKAVIPAAGYGLRFLPATKTIPKEMFPIIDKPNLAYIVEEAFSAGIDEVFIIVSPQKKAIVDYFTPNPNLEAFIESKNNKDLLEVVKNITKNKNIQFIYQEEALGLGHAILQVKKYINDEPFAVLLGDDLFKGNIPAIKELIDKYDKYGGSIVGTINIKKEDTTKYGICELQDKMDENTFLLKDIIEKPLPKNAPSLKASAGRYILSPKIFELLETQKPGVNNEIQLTDSIRRLIATENVYSYDIKAKRYDIGSKLGYIESVIDFSLEDDELKESVLEIIKKRVKNQGPNSF